MYPRRGRVAASDPLTTITADAYLQTVVNTSCKFLGKAEKATRSHWACTKAAEAAAMPRVAAAAVELHSDDASATMNNDRRLTD